MRQLHLLASIVSWAVFCTYSTASAQRVVPRQFNDVQMYTDQLNKQKAERKNAMIAEARTRAHQSKATIERCGQKLAQLAGPLKSADAELERVEEAFEDSEAELRASRKKRADLETRLLAEQEETSTYRAAMKVLTDAEAQCAQQAERILHRPVKDGSPDKLLFSLPKNERAALEADKGWVGAHRQFSTAKDGVGEETRRLIAGDTTISELDASIDRLQTDQLKWKNERSRARKAYATLKNEASSFSSTMNVAQRNLAAAQRDIAMASGR